MEKEIKQNDEFSEEILEEIDFLKGKVKNFNLLTEIINERHKTNFDYEQVKYRAYKIIDEKQGKPS